MPSVSKPLAMREPSRPESAHRDLDQKTSVDAGLESRLDGWKQIAAYLGRGERTVKRWEASRGLPLHRIPGDGRRSVFAYAAELDEWLRSSGGEEASQGDAGARGAAPAAGDGTVEAPETGADTPLIPPVRADQLPPSARTPGGPELWRTTAFYAAVVLGLALALLRFGSLHRRGSDTVSAAGLRSASGSEDARAPLAPPVSVEEQSAARELYLKGRYAWNQRTPDSLNRAVDDFTAAIVHDPNYAEAYVGLAETYALLRQFSNMPDSDAFPRSLAAAQKAVELDGSLAEAHRALAFAQMYGSLDFRDAEREFRRAIELDPRDPVARRWYANAFGVPGHFKESLEQMNEAQALDPASHATLADKGWMLFLAGRREEGIGTLREVESAVPGFVSPHSYLMQAGLELRDYPMFLDEGAKMAAAKDDATLAQIFSAARKAYASGGETGLLQAVYDQGRRRGVESNSLSLLMAKVCARLGRNQEALQILEDEYAHRDPNVLSCLSHPSLMQLRDEPRYQALVKRLNFPVHAPDASPGYLIGMNQASYAALH